MNNKYDINEDSNLKKSITTDMYSYFFYVTYFLPNPNKPYDKLYTIDDYAKLIRALNKEIYIPDMKLPSLSVVNKRISEISIYFNHLESRATEPNPVFQKNNQKIFNSDCQKEFYSRLKKLFYILKIVDIQKDSVPLYLFPLYMGIIISSSKQSAGWSKVKECALNIALNILEVLRKDIKIRIALEDISWNLIYSNFLDYIFPDSIYNFIDRLNQAQLMVPERFLLSVRYNLDIYKSNLLNSFFFTATKQNIFFKQALTDGEKYIFKLEENLQKLAECNLEDRSKLEILSIEKIGLKLIEMHEKIYEQEFLIYQNFISSKVNERSAIYLSRHITNKI